ncbi:High mobility group protein B2 [Tupaia chinensis]|uniref:High mobility group protein B2 n=1 Tax=Tupaia chinensis TaxID=246437 RepID=L9LDH8_TUPCH|nr:High mobility group protein B2 [Tupaia chinensis]
MPAHLTRTLSHTEQLRGPQEEEHKRKHPDSSVNFAEFSKKYWERWKTMSAKGKLEFEDMAKCDKTHDDRKMKNYVPRKGDKKGKKKDPNALKRPPSAFFLFCSGHLLKIKSEHPGLSIGNTAKKMGEMWSEQSAKEKRPCEQKAAKLTEKYEIRLRTVPRAKVTQERRALAGQQT